MQNLFGKLFFNFMFLEKQSPNLQLKSEFLVPKDKVLVALVTVSVAILSADW